jgi:hypothetical protein
MIIGGSNRLPPFKKNIYKNKSLGENPEMRKTFKIIMLLFLILIPVQSFAILYDYSVLGQFQIDGVTNYVTGNMTISNEFLYHERVGSQSAFYSFNITQFSLILNGANGPLNFSGNNGMLEYLPMILVPQVLYETQYRIGDQSPDYWLNPYDGSVEMFTNDMNQYDPTSSDNFGELAPIIALGGPHYTSQFNSSNTGGGTIWLTREADPVPEPSIIFLLVVGLAGMGFIRKRIKT